MVLLLALQNACKHDKKRLIVVVVIVDMPFLEDSGGSNKALTLCILHSDQRM